jgi:hypothetical protein
MTAPNLKNPTSITGKTARYAVTNTAGNVLSNATSSGKVLKINSIFCANVDGTNNADISVSIYSGIPGKTILTFTAGSGTTIIGEANETYTAVSGVSDGAGTGATFTISRDAAGEIDSVTLVSAGADYDATDTITIDGVSIGGVSETDDLIITVDTVSIATNFHIAKTIVVPADATQILCSKDTYFYLEEGDSIRAFASANGDLELVVGYEEIL